MSNHHHHSSSSSSSSSSSFSNQILSSSSLSIFLNAITAGSLFTYPIFSPALQTILQFSVNQLSATASLAILAQYLSAAFWGSLVDRHGARPVSFAAAMLFFVGYTILAYMLSHPPDILPGHSFDPPQHPATLACWITLTLGYCLCGAATAASYFSAITAATQVFGDMSPGVAVAGPSSLFGLSPLLLTFLGTSLFGRDDHFDTVGYLSMLAILTLVVNLFGAIGLPSCKDDLNLHQDERTALLVSSSLPAPSSNLAVFLRDPALWLLGILVLLSAGPPEMTIATIGAVVDVEEAPLLQNDPHSVALKAHQVQLISLANTITRLASGWASDKLSRGPRPTPRLIFLALASTLYAIVCLTIATTSHNPLLVLSLLTGICYGTLFTLAPSLVATVWPIRDFGRNYGIISYFSATGSFLFTALFGIIFDERNGNQRVKDIYGICGLSELVAVGLAFGLYQYWNKLQLSEVDDLGARERETVRVDD